MDREKDGGGKKVTGEEGGRGGRERRERGKEICYENSYEFSIDAKKIEIEPTLKILGVTLDKTLSYKPHITNMLTKAYSKIAALRRIKRLVPSGTMITLHKSYILLPHLEYCSPILLGISRALNTKLENVNFYALRTLLNLGSTVNYDTCLSMANMVSLEQRRFEQSLILFFKCFKMRGPSYISDLFTPRLTPYNLRSSGLNVNQPSYNNLYMHNSFIYIISHIWNQLPTTAKLATSISEFRSHIKGMNFSGCQCNRCL